jgi:hypothetical protein
VNRAYSWLYCVIRNILSKESWLGFSPGFGFSQDKFVEVLVVAGGIFLTQLFLEKKIPRRQRKTIEQLKNTPKKNKVK